MTPLKNLIIRLLKPKALTQEEIAEKLSELFEADVKKFSANGAKAFGHIFAKHGIDDPQKWLENKMREGFTGQGESLYFIDSNMRGDASCTSTGIKFKSFRFVKSNYTRAHELSHKITDEYIGGKVEKGMLKRSGILIIKKEDKKTGEIHHTGTEHGRALNEGITNLLAEKLLGRKQIFGVPYTVETFVARVVAKRVGEDAVFEAAFFDPKILADKWNEHKKNKNSYIRLVSFLDSYSNGLTNADEAIGAVMSKITSKLSHRTKMIFSKKYRHERKAKTRMMPEREMERLRAQFTENNHSQVNLKTEQNPLRRDLLHLREQSVKNKQGISMQQNKSSYNIEHKF